jgi:hypothetical protein
MTKIAVLKDHKTFYHMSKNVMENCTNLVGPLFRHWILLGITRPLHLSVPVSFLSTFWYSAAHNILIDNFSQEEITMSIHN